MVNRPMPNRMDVWARSSATPMARSTYEGSRLALVQALPEDTARFCARGTQVKNSSLQKINGGCKNLFRIMSN